jgi:hypothetical protein
VCWCYHASIAVKTSSPPWSIMLLSDVGNGCSHHMAAIAMHDASSVPNSSCNASALVWFFVRAAAVLLLVVCTRVTCGR